MQKALQALGDAPEYFPAPQQEYAVPEEIVYRNNQWYLDNGNCHDAHRILYVVGYGPKKHAPCKPNEVDVPRVVGANLRNAEARLHERLRPHETPRQPAPG